MTLSVRQRTTAFMLVVGVLAGAQSARAQQDPVIAELDAFWVGVVQSVVDWSIPAQQATYHPDAVGVKGTVGADTTYLLADDFARRIAESTTESGPPIRRVLEFRWSSRVHDAQTAHEVGLYHYWAEGRPHYYGTVDSYLVKRDGQWLILVEIQHEPGVTEADWNALR